MTAQGFFQELNRLIKDLPRPETRVVYSENCTFCSDVSRSKNLTYCFDTHRSTDSTYLFDSFMCTDCLDGDYNVECESCYDCVDCFKCYNSAYMQYSARCNNSYYSAYCTNCTDVFGSVHLTNKSFCLFNRQLTEQQYREEVKKYMAMPPEKILKMVEDLMNQYPRTQSAGEHNANSPYGNYLYYCKNCYMCFDSANSENLIHGYDTFNSKNLVDTTYTGQNNTNCYQMVDSGDLNNVDYAIDSYHCQDSSYVVASKGLKNCFGCVGLQYKQYCVLNRQLSKEEYESVTQKLQAELSAANLEWDNIVY